MGRRCREEACRKWARCRGRPEREVSATPTSGTTATRKDNFTAYKLLIADVIGGNLEAVPRGVMAAGAIMQGSRGGVDLPKGDIDRVKSHLAKYYKKMGDDDAVGRLRLDFGL